MHINAQQRPIVDAVKLLKESMELNAQESTERVRIRVRNYNRSVRALLSNPERMLRETLSRVHRITHQRVEGKRHFSHEQKALIVTAFEDWCAAGRSTEQFFKRYDLLPQMLKVWSGQASVRALLSARAKPAT